MEPITGHEAAVRPENRRISLNLLVFAGGGVLLVILLALSLTQGELHIPLRTVYEAIVHPQNIAEHQTIRGLRLPRAVMGILAGAALAAAGALLQTVTRNALAEAGTFGINAGAYFAVVLCTIFIPSLIHSSPLITALLGGCLGAGLSYLLAGA
ncbi:iron chelate uptake ABC transporter family permease subunit, partial [Paenibacillus sp. AR247]|uniref:iron chelate uptake ABC transporter family permease subunit n=1 Tax=Paenibacillus sp. AR247 TaxID=1631599 RepID=UPI0015E34179